ncbi:MAG: hypothetical protein ACOC1P_05895, partial [Minisyncoccales bacterium]
KIILSNQNYINSKFYNNCMIITIDTKKDSSEDIKKAIGFLNQFINNTSIESTSQTSTTEPQQGAFNIFGGMDTDSNPISNDTKEETDSEINSNSDDDKDSEINIVPY